MSDDRETDDLLHAIGSQMPPLDQGQQMAFLIAEVRGMRRETRDLKKDMGEVKTALSTGNTTFATTDFRVQAIAARVLVLEQAKAQADAQVATPKAPHWLVQSAVSTVVGAVGLAVVWFLLQGALANANGPTTRIDRSETITTPTPARSAP